ncbi:hypothetical protein POM88_001523 [Heracleum sosnowskyi]|uniref:Auxin-responsive protein n=1 Tax=Heracleum sosnowskyi TaxID=360622 RepID=A0AAD8JDQ9_9APIA|nr:hypothetical protein POM88_001523 [Heracleum sosnowskyi]
MEALEATGKRLSDFADKLGLPFEFSPVTDKVGNLDPERINVSKKEAGAVHWLQHSLYDVTSSDANTLWLLQRNAPAPVVGWPPIRSFRKNIASNSSSKLKVEPKQQNLAPPLKSANEKQVKNCCKGLFVKINMDGVPIDINLDESRSSVGCR